MDDAFAVSRMPEIGLSGSMWRGPETERWQAYSGTKPETADTDKANLHATAPAPDPTGVRVAARSREAKHHGVGEAQPETVSVLRRDAKRHTGHQDAAFPSAIERSAGPEPVAPTTHTRDGGVFGGRAAVDGARVSDAEHGVVGRARWTVEEGGIEDAAVGGCGGVRHRRAARLTRVGRIAPTGPTQSGQLRLATGCIRATHNVGACIVVAHFHRDGVRAGVSCPPACRGPAAAYKGKTKQNEAPVMHGVQGTQSSGHVYGPGEVSALATACPSGGAANCVVIGVGGPGFGSGQEPPDLHHNSGK
jgi:hypothetical protein